MTSPSPRRLSSIAAVLLAALAASTAPRAQQQAPDPSVYRALFDKAVELFEPTGLAVAVVQGDEVVLETGHGLLEVGGEAEVTAHTVFNIASCSKAFTATAVGLCVERGLCDWDDLVIEHLPAFRMADPWITAHLTVRDLLCHRSGLVTFAGDLLWYGSDRSDDEVFAGIAKLPTPNRFRFKRPWKDGTKLVVFEPLVLIERLAALVPRPHRNLVTYHGAFAPAASHRERVVPVPPEDEGERPAFRSRQRRPCRAVGEKREKKPHWRRRWTWAELMRRSFGVDILICPHCETRRRLLTFITDPRTITRVLSHLGHPAELPPLSPARPPPEAPGLWEE